MKGNIKIKVFIVMINEEVLKEKLKYLLTVPARENQFDIISFDVEFDYTNKERQKLDGYDITIKFDYEGGLDVYMYHFLKDVESMSDKLRIILNSYVISEDGKLTRGEDSNCNSGEGMVWNIEFESDTKHIFNMGFNFIYSED
jgi:hypothetical protein